MAKLKSPHVVQKGKVIIPISRETVKKIVELYGWDKSKPICLVDSPGGLTAANWEIDKNNPDIIII